MGKQGNHNNNNNSNTSGGGSYRSRKSENMTIGKGKVTAVQIAFIVDRYLSDNNYAQTRSTFRSEASNLISKSSVQEVILFPFLFFLSKKLIFTGMGLLLLVLPIN